jgi:5-(hydroxymethyl)furfural/furfural oxidase
MLPANPPLGLLNAPGLTSLASNLGVRLLPHMPPVVRRRALAASIGPGRFLDDVGRGAAFDELVLDSYTAMFHPAGSCALGRVVDAFTRVKGVDGLYVVDASIMPSVPRANTNVPTSMVAERAADLIGAQLHT